MKWKGKEIDLEPDDLFPAPEEMPHDSIRRVIARAPSHYAYYLSRAAEVSAAIRETERMREMRYNERYAEVAEEKKTESWKKARVYEMEKTFFQKADSRLAALEELRSKLRALAHAFDLQIKALQTAGGLIRTEMEAIMSENSVLEG